MQAGSTAFLLHEACAIYDGHQREKGRAYRRIDIRESWTAGAARPRTKYTMGTIPGTLITSAAEYLLDILLVEESVLYARFYDGTEETREKLIEGIGTTAEDADCMVWKG